MEKPVLNILEQGETHEPSFYVCLKCKTVIAPNGSNTPVPGKKDLDRVIVFENVINVACEGPVPPEWCEELKISPVFARSYSHAYCANCKTLLGAKIVDSEEFAAFIHGVYLLHRINLALEIGNQCNTHNDIPMESPAPDNLEQEQTQESSYFACLECGTDIALNERNIIPAGLKETDRMVTFTANIINVAIVGPVQDDLFEKFQIAKAFSSQFFQVHCANCKKLLGANMANLGGNCAKYIDGVYILYRNMLILKLGNQIYTYNDADSTYNVQG